MKIILAPMEGLVDHLMREILTQLGGFDQCVTEFIRVNDQLLPSRVFYRLCPELKQQGKTMAGTPVIVQLLGGKPEPLAANAAIAAKLGAPGIDLNFGCPAKTVNRHDGGAVLLKQPQRLFDIVNAVRKAVPDHIPVTAKMRLGFDDKTLALENAQAIEAAGANGLTVHARTKVEGYRPPAHWEWIAKICDVTTIPVTANGEVWSVADYQRCKEVSDCENVMIGRGAIRTPDLALQIQKHNQSLDYFPKKWHEIEALLLKFFDMIQPHMQERYVCNRMKQWVSLLIHGYPEAQGIFNQIKKMKSAHAIQQTIRTKTMQRTLPYKPLI